MKSLAIRNGLWNALSNVAGGLSAILGSIIIVRSLDPESYGTFSYYMWLASMLITLGTLAFPTSLTKVTAELIGKDEASEASALSRSVVLGLVLLNLLIAGSVILWAFLGSPERQPYLLVIAALIVPSAAAGILLSVFWGQERYRPVSILYVVASSVQIILIVLAFQMDLGIQGFIAASLSANVIQSIGLTILITIRGEQGTSTPRSFSLPQRGTIRHFAAFTTPATLVQIFAVIVWERSEIFFLERLSTIEQVGIYGVAYTMFTMTMYLGWALVNGFYPALSRDYGAGRWDAIREKFQQAISVATLYAVPLTFGAIVCMERIIVTLYGEKMLPAVPVAQILMAGLTTAVIASVLGISVTAVGGIWTHVRLGFLMSIINIVLSLVLIPPFGAIGAAIGNTVSQAIHVVILAVLVRHRYSMRLPYLQMARIIGAGMVSGLMIPLIVLSQIPGAFGLLLAVATGGASYAAAIWLQGLDQLLSTSELAPQSQPVGD